MGPFVPSHEGRLSLGGGIRRSYNSSMAASSAIELSNSSTTEVEAAVALLTAAADPVRWTILRRLTAGQACVCELQAEVAVAPNLLSYHLKVLREVDLVTCARRGRWIDYQLAGDATARLTAALPGIRRAER